MTSTLRILPELTFFVLGPYYLVFQFRWRWDLFDWSIVAIAGLILVPALAMDFVALRYNRTEYRHELVVYEHRRDRARRFGDLR